MSFLLFGRFLPELGGARVLPLFLSHALKSLISVRPHGGETSPAIGNGH
jgi:hypothetical protein